MTILHEFKFLEAAYIPSPPPLPIENRTPQAFVESSVKLVNNRGTYPPLIPVKRNFADFKLGATGPGLFSADNITKSDRIYLPRPGINTLRPSATTHLRMNKYNGGHVRILFA